MKHLPFTRRFFSLLLLLLACSLALPQAEARRKKKKKRSSVLRVWKKSFTSKKRFGRRPKSKKREQWVQIGKIAPPKHLQEYFGKVVPIRCQLTRSNHFSCEGRSTNGTLLMDASSAWPRGKIKITILVKRRGMSMQLYNKWAKTWTQKKRPSKR